jgi:hypothetical protein
MSPLELKQKRAEQARINGAKSTGPKTPEGLKAAQTATLTHGLYATEETLKASIDPEAFEALRQKYHRIWAPPDEYTAERVDDLAFARWDLNRLQLARRNEITELFLQTNSVIETEVAASAPGSIIERLDARIRRQQLTISRLERDILRLKKQLNAEGPSHESAATATFSTGPCYQETPKSQENPTANPEIPAPPPVEPVQQPDTALHT